MRNTFVETLCQLAAEDERIWLVCGDLGFSVLEVFAAKFPDRYLNAGVSEQNMTGLAAGLAHSGKIVFTYSIANFPVMRCLEQIRNDVCYHNLPVKVVAVGGGLAYGPQGYTHHGVEDLAVTRVLPNMTVVAPGDPAETRLATRALVADPGPAYLRLGKAKEPLVHKTDPQFELGKIIQLRAGADITLMSTGGILDEVVKAADLLASRNIKATILSMHTLTSLDEAALTRVIEMTGCILTIEEHGLGGLGTVIGNYLAENSIRCVFHSMNLGAQAISVAGSQNFLRERCGLSAVQIAARAEALIAKKRA